MSYVHKPALQPFESRTLMQLFDIHANSHPDREAFVLFNATGQRSSHTFLQMQERSLHLAASFLRIGWKRGQRVALMVPNQIEYLLSYMALFRIGVNVILVPSAGLSVDNVIGILQRSKCLGIVVCASKESSFNTQLHSGLMNMHFTIVWIDAGGFGTQSNKSYDFNNLMKPADMLDIDKVIKEQKKAQFDDPAMVVFTSGSTGLPKGVQYTNHFLINKVISNDVSVMRVGMQNGSPSRVFHDRPFYWIYHVGVINVLAMGHTLVSTPSMKSVKDCDIEFVLKVIQNEKCNIAVLMPYMIVDLLHHPNSSKYDLSCVKVAATGSQPFQATFLQKLKTRLPECNIFYQYGLTETPVIASQKINYYTNEEGDDAGLDLAPGYELKLIDEDSRLVPIGEVGEICVRSTVQFHEYLDNAEATSEAISSTGWVHTGDLGFLNQKGKLTVCGRKSEMIKRATLKIFPAQVEKVLLQYPDVKDAMLIGVPDVRLCEELCACVIPKKGSTLESSVAEFEEWISSQWTPDEQGLTMKPKYTLLMKEFPRTKTGKPDRKTVKVEAARKLGIELN